MHKPTTIAALFLLTAASAQAQVPAYSGFQMLARTNFASNPGGAFNVPGSWFFSGEDIRINNSRQVAFRLNVTSGSFMSVWLGAVVPGGGPTGTGTVVYSSNPADDAFISRVSINNIGRIIWEQNFTGGTPGLYFHDIIPGTSGLLTTRPFGTSSWSSPNVNDNNEVGFRANFGTNRQSFTSWSPASPNTTIDHAVEAGLDPGSPYSFLFTPSFNNQRQIAGFARRGTAGQTGGTQPDEIRIFNANGTNILIARDADATPTSPYASFDSSVALSNNGKVAFMATLAAGGRGVFLYNGSTIITIATTTAPGTQISNLEFFAPSVNDNGVVAFRAFDTAGKRAIWVGDGTTLRKLVTAQDLIVSDLGTARVDQNVASSPVFGGAPSINAAGDVAFNAALTPPDNNQIEWGTGVYVALVAPPPPCPGDLNNDGSRNTVDLTLFLSAFGTTVTPSTNGPDFDNNGTVNTADLVTFLALFGVPCP
ncbi:MAG: choice-of-anchor tandem repeat NxxGxxAF-containing protein [Phycisphaerales bacterium]